MRKIITSLLITFVSIFLFSVNNTYAKVVVEEEGTVNISKNETINDDLFIGAQNAVVDGVVNGDVFIGAQTVKIGGTINGTLHVGAQSLYVTGNVTRNIYAGVQNLTLTGSKVGGSLITGGQSVLADAQTTIGGSFLAGAANITMDSKVTRNVTVATGTLSIGKEARIGKDLYYAAGEDEGLVSIENPDSIVGEIYKSEHKALEKNVKFDKAETTKVFNAFKFVGTVVSFLGALLVGLISIKFFESHMNDASKYVSNSFWKSMGIGFLTTLVFVPASIILLLTVVGIPLVGVSAVVLILFSYLAKLVVGLSLGNYISTLFKWKLSTLGVFMLGLIGVYVLKEMPIVGFLASLVVLWSGLGGLLLHVFKADK